MKKTITPILGQVLQKIAPRIGATVVMEPEWGIVGQIVFKNGRKRYFRYSTIDLNTMGASEIARDKGYAKFFMKRMGYPVVEGRTFYSDRWAKAICSRDNIDAAYRYACKLKFPVIVKPNSGSQGTGVTLVQTKTEFYQALKGIFLYDRVALVERVIVGTDYRIVVLDGRVISAYERRPLSVIGNGRSTILQLLKEKERIFVASSRDTRLKIDDPRIAMKLDRQGLSFWSKAVKGKRVYLLDNANLSSGGEAVDVTDCIHESFKATAIALTHDMGLRLCGVDLMVDGDISKLAEKYWILEINSAPGLDHYARSGGAQQQIVEDLYVQVLESMEVDR